MAGQMTSLDIMTSQPWYHFVEQAQGYLINVSLVRCALTEQKPEGVPSIPPLYHGGGTI